jgi:CO dehydrogenase/acetyl-CoA synthase epsilon subunit
MTERRKAEPSGWRVYDSIRHGMQEALPQALRKVLKKANKPLLTSQKLFENQTKPDYPALS